MKEKITLSLDQHENARHGEEIFPLQKYETPLWKEYPYVTAHWHEEAEFTRIEKGSCTYQIQLETYDVEEGDLIFIPACGAGMRFPMKKRSACSRKRMCFIWIFLVQRPAGYLCHPVFESTDEPEIDPAVCNQKRTSALRKGSRSV